MRLTMTTFLSLDGVMQGPGDVEEDQSDGFDQGVGSSPYADADMGRFVSGWFAVASGFLLGRKTYQILAAQWPNITDENDPVAAKLNSLPEYVVSTTPHNAEWNNSTLIMGLVDTKTTSSGVVVHTYQPAGKPAYGSLAFSSQ